MAPVKYDRVVSYSSEDPVHKVENLLNPETRLKWKCKTMGESQVTAILQLTKQVQIVALDIGNEYSAFVEVFAARSSLPDEYKVLLPSVCMMTMQDSRQGVNVNSVRFFKSDSLLHTDETFDRIRILCSQPFNKCVQYGLAFLTVHSAPTENKEDIPSSIVSPSSRKLGNFVLKDDDPKTSTSFSLGNWFSKRKSISPPKEYVKVAKTSLASQIREDSNPHLVKADKPKISKKKTNDFSGRRDVKVPDNDGSARRAARGPLFYVPDEDENSNDSKDAKTEKTDDAGPSSKTPGKQVKPSASRSEKKDSKGHDTRKEVKNDSKVSDPKPESKDPNTQKNNTKTNSDSAKNSQTDKTASSKIQRKPFGELLHGVTFVISGFENPLRGDLRNQALEMGAFYKANWDRTCTHLICAFPNTPKCRDVQKVKGKIVTKDWVADCYNQCKRLPWRRYALLRADQDQSESEEEIEEDRQSTPHTVLSRVLLGSPSTSQATLPSSSQSQDTSNSPTVASSNSPAKASSDDTDLYDEDTDIEDSADFSGKLPCRVFSPIFEGLSFLVHASIDGTLRDKLFRYITTYGGYCSCESQAKHTPIPKLGPDNHVDYILAQTLDSIEKKKYGKTQWVRSDWVWECVNQKKMVSIEQYKVLF